MHTATSTAGQVTDGSDAVCLVLAPMVYLALTIGHICKLGASALSVLAYGLRCRFNSYRSGCLKSDDETTVQRMTRHPFGLMPRAE